MKCFTSIAMLLHLVGGASHSALRQRRGQHTGTEIPGDDATRALMLGRVFIVDPTLTPRTEEQGPTCPSNVAGQYQNQEGVRPCNTNADCIGFQTIDGSTCCLHPHCICGNPDPGASANVQCVAGVNNNNEQELTGRTEQGGNQSFITTPFSIGNNNGVRSCPEEGSSSYADQEGSRVCTTNEDCEGFETIDGPTCCLHPYCLCGNREPGAATLVQCVD